MTMDQQTIDLVRYGITSAFWLGVVWVVVRGIVSIITARSAAKALDRFGR